MSTSRGATRSRCRYAAARLRDRFVLRLIALDRVLHVLVLSVITLAIFFFAHDREQLRKVYVRVLADLQGGLGGPIFDTTRGIFHEANRLFASVEDRALSDRDAAWPSTR